jgi:altronate dehydratase
MKKKNYIIIDSKDNCATAVDNIPQDAKIELNNKTININESILLGHKFAIVNVKKGSPIIKYGEVIGISKEDINEGDWIHMHNIKSRILSEVLNDG